MRGGGAWDEAVFQKNIKKSSYDVISSGKPIGNVSDIVKVVGDGRDWFQTVFWKKHKKYGISRTFCPPAQYIYIYIYNHLF